MTIKKTIKKMGKATKDALNYVADSCERFERSQRYEVDAFCCNCQYHGKVFVLKGIPIKNAFQDKRCPKCGCFTLMKDYFILIRK
jgi:hypothetical protein